MRGIVIIALVLCLATWFGFTLVLSGFIPTKQLAVFFPNLILPKTTGELGASLTIVEGIFSSLAVVFALVAVLLQGKELKKSTDAQRSQAGVLSAQLNQQTQSVRLSAYSARLQFLVAEIDRLNEQIQRLVVEAESEIEPDRKSEKWEIIRNSRALHGRHREQARAIDESIVGYLGDVGQPSI